MFTKSIGREHLPQTSIAVDASERHWLRKIGLMRLTRRACRAGIRRTRLNIGPAEESDAHHEVPPFTAQKRMEVRRSCHVADGRGIQLVREVIDTSAQRKAVSAQGDHALD